MVRRLDPETQTLTLSPTLTEQPLKFQLAASIGLLVLDRERLLERIVGDARTAARRDAAADQGQPRQLLRRRADAAATATSSRRCSAPATTWSCSSNIFGTTYETVAHRLCNLADPKRTGIPFHFLRADIAGNISKRYSGTGLKFASGGGSCGKWAVHLAFLNPSQLTRQYSMMPDGTTYFCFAKVQLQPIEGSIVRGTAYSHRPGHPRGEREVPGLRPAHHRPAQGRGAHRHHLPLLRAHRLQPARGGQLPVRLLLRRVHEEGLLLLPPAGARGQQGRRLAPPPRRRLIPSMPDISTPRFALASGAPAGTRADVLVLFAEEAPSPNGAVAEVNQALAGQLVRAATEEGFRGKADQTFVLHTHGRLPVSRVVLVGTGPRERTDAEALRQAAGRGVKAAQRVRARSVAMAVPGKIRASRCARWPRARRWAPTVSTSTGPRAARSGWRWRRCGFSSPTARRARGRWRECWSGCSG